MREVDFARTPRLGPSPLGFALLSIVAWELICRYGKISPVLLAPPPPMWR